MSLCLHSQIYENSSETKTKDQTAQANHKPQILLNTIQSAELKCEV